MQVLTRAQYRYNWLMKKIVDQQRLLVIADNNAVNLGGSIDSTNSGDFQSYNLEALPLGQRYYVLINNALYPQDDPELSFTVVNGDAVFNNPLPADLRDKEVKLISI